MLKTGLNVTIVWSKRELNGVLEHVGNTHCTVRATNKQLYLVRKERIRIA